MILIGNGVHNFCDGIVIAAAFLADPALGIATTVAIVAHAVPQQVGDFAVLIHSGFTRDARVHLQRRRRPRDARRRARRVLRAGGHAAVAADRARDRRGKPALRRRRRPHPEPAPAARAARDREADALIGLGVAVIAWCTSRSSTERAARSAATMRSATGAYAGAAARPPARNRSASCPSRRARRSAVTARRPRWRALGRRIWAPSWREPGVHAARPLPATPPRRRLHAAASRWSPGELAALNVQFRRVRRRCGRRRSPRWPAGTRRGRCPPSPHAAPGDRRFARAWSEQPYFALLKQGYLLSANTCRARRAAPLPEPTSAVSRS